MSNEQYLWVVTNSYGGWGGTESYQTVVGAFPTMQAAKAWIERQKDKNKDKLLDDNHYDYCEVMMMDENDD